MSGAGSQLRIEGLDDDHLFPRAETERFGLGMDSLEEARRALAAERLETDIDSVVHEPTVGFVLQKIDRTEKPGRIGRFVNFRGMLRALLTPRQIEETEVPD